MKSTEKRACGPKEIANRATSDRSKFIDRLILVTSENMKNRVPGSRVVVMIFSMLFRLVYSEAARSKPN